MLNKNVMCLTFKLANKALISGEWFEACHSFNSKGSNKGDFEITTQMIMDFVNNFKNGAYRRWKDENGNWRLKINYEHWHDTKAGWITDAKYENKQMTDGSIETSLLLKGDWTPDAVTANRNGYYEYFSIEYDLFYKDDQNGREWNNVLMGGALTDDPFAMEMQPIALSVYSDKSKELRKDFDNKMQKLNADSELEKIKKEEELEMEKLLKALKSAGIELKADASEADVALAVNKLIEANEKSKTEFKTVKDKLTETETELTNTKEKLTVAEDKAGKYEELKTKTEKEAKDSLISQAIKELKYSKAECEEEGTFGQLLSVLGVDKAKEHLANSPVRFDKTITPVNDGEVDLTNDEVYAKELKALAEKEKISVESADQKLRVKKAEQIKAKEAK